MHFKIKGHDVSITPVKDSSTRRAVQIANKVVETFMNIGLTGDDVDVVEEKMPMKRTKAVVKWYVNGTMCYYSFSRAGPYVDNLQVILKVIEITTAEVATKKKSVEDFISEFSEEKDVEERREDARKALGVDEKSVDMKEIDAAFKKMSKTAHPDMPGGSTEGFKKLNEAHKTLRRELE